MANSRFEPIFSISPDIRYVATYRDGELAMESRPSEKASSAESDKYEELFVNPTLLLLAEQRGNVDCGGLDFLLVRYGNFYQFVQRTRGGHVSVCIEPEADPLVVVAALRDHDLGSL